MGVLPRLCSCASSVAVVPYRQGLVPLSTRLVFRTLSHRQQATSWHFQAMRGVSPVTPGSIQQPSRATTPPVHAGQSDRPAIAPEASPEEDGASIGASPAGEGSGGLGYLQKIADNMMQGEWGGRGETWVFLQFLFGIPAVIPPPQVTSALEAVGLTSSGMCSIAELWSVPVGGILLALGLGAAAASGQALGTNLSPFPKPAPGGKLVKDGVYKYVRHPMYLGLLVTLYGIAEATCSPGRVLMTTVLAFVLDRKASREEEFLIQTYGHEYLEHRKVTKKIVPFVY